MNYDIRHVAGLHVWLDSYVLGQHYVRKTEESEWQKCPLGDQCHGLACRSSDTL
jgi:hypothetical protein